MFYDILTIKALTGGGMVPGSGSLASAWLANVCHSACPVMLAVTNLSGNFLFIGLEPEIINTQLIMSVSTISLL